ncbi:putative G-protein coupled receptor 125, partial [Arapaima gigas]
DRVSNNKGEFRWPRTLAGLTVYLPCHRLASGAGLYSASSVEDRRAWRRCDPAGFWAEEDYSRCQYQKDVTRVLHIINQ